MSRKFREANYEATEKREIKLGEALPEEHLARFIVSVVGVLDLSEFYAKYSEKGGMPYAPEVMIGLMVYGYATGIFSTRGIEKATYESIPFRYIAGDMHPDHTTISQFRKENLEEMKGIFVQVLMIAKLMGHVELGNISIDGSKIHADASKSKAVSYGKIEEMEKSLRKEIEELFAIAATSEKEREDEVNIDEEIRLRKERLLGLSEAKAVLEARSKARYEEAKAEYANKMKARAEKATGKKPRGRVPKEPTPDAPEFKEQYNFTDPESRIMKNGNNSGYDQSYNVQAAVEQDNQLIVGNTLSNHPNDKQEGVPTVKAIPAQLGTPDAATMDNGYLSKKTIETFEQMGIDPYIALGRERHYMTVSELFEGEPERPPDNADYKVKMAYKLRTQAGKAIYKLRKSTVEPVFGIIKEVMGFRQFSLRGLAKAAGEWNLVCLAYNLKRLHVLHLT